ncbi:hypothetical protein FACS189461_4930 [Spirochaetia bacterium]|nr:hypothetical protein FACS189461_4930 [Spirochaetia bacterium]
MIKLQRPNEPRKLLDNKVVWQASLDVAIATHGSYEQIPEKDRNKLIIHYKDKEIKEPLFESSHQKCAYCECNATEGGGYMEVEHFKPKSLYPEFVFEWANLLPACRRCNGMKGVHDTGAEPIINPYDTDPEKAFVYKRIQIKAKDGIYFEMAARTIKVCRLNDERLLTSRSKIMPRLERVCMALEKAIDNYNVATLESEKHEYLRNIKEALSTVEITQENTETYAGFCRFFFKSDDAYNKAKELVSA